MPFGKSLLAFVALAMSAAPAFAAGNSVIGKLNLTTGTFSPLPATTAATAKTYSGTIQVALTITIKSALPAKQTYLCGVTVEVFDPTTGSEGGSADASVVETASGSVLKCTVSIPYAWALTASSSAALNWTVTASQSSGASRSIGGGLASFSPVSTPSPKLTVTGVL
jgi:hypothetical protein